MSSVSLQNVRKEYGNIIAADDISLDIRSGELIVFVGPSGCGKTTTLRMIAGLETPTSGTINFAGTDVTQRTPQERNISMVFQDLALYPHMTAAENIAFPLKAEKKNQNSEIQERVRRVAEMVNCDAYLEKKVTELSGGQQQRVALARALIREPDVFLLDEPLSDLDELMKRQIRTSVEQLQNELEITMIHVTHDQEEAMTMGDRLVVMNDGEIAQVGSPSETFEKPRNLFVAGFIGSPQINQFPCTVTENDSQTQLSVAGREFRVPKNLTNVLARRSLDELSLCIRPQHISWHEEAPEDKISMPVTIKVLEQTGTEEVAHCRTEDGLQISLVHPAGELDEEQSGHLVFDSEKILIYDGQTQDAELLN